MLREPFNALSHALGVPLALLGSLFLLLLAPQEVWSALLVFGLTMALMLAASALYHALKVEDRALAWLRRLDHAAIFLFIAGSYTPFLVEGLEGSARSFALGLIWGLALLGVAFRLLFLKAPRWLYTLAYLGLGWLSVLFLPRLELPFSTFALMATSLRPHGHLRGLLHSGDPGLLAGMAQPLAQEGGLSRALASPCSPGKPLHVLGGAEPLRLAFS